MTQVSKFEVENKKNKDILKYILSQKLEEQGKSLPSNKQTAVLQPYDNE